MEAGTDYFANPDKQPRPYVVFEMRATETRDEAGKPQVIDVVWAKVTPSGSRDTLEKPAKDWIESIRVQADAGRVPPEWPRQYAQALESFIKGEELPVHGFPIKLWAAVTPGQRKAILDAGIQTVEDLALANEEAVGRIGMGARRLVDAAKAWKADQDGPGSLAAKLEIAETARAEAVERIATLEKQVQQLLAAVPADQKAKADKPAGVVTIGA